jgi:hypothetical protein
MTPKQKMLYELRYLCAAWFMLWLYWQYAFVYWCIRSAPDRWTWALLPVWLPLGAAFIVQNVVFNATIGALLFRDWPRQWLFSDRLRALPKDDRMLDRFQVLLNYHDPDHI